MANISRKTKTKHPASELALEKPTSADPYFVEDVRGAQDSH